MKKYIKSPEFVITKEQKYMHIKLSEAFLKTLDFLVQDMYICTNLRTDFSNNCLFRVGKYLKNILEFYKIFSIEKIKIDYTFIMIVLV